MFAVTNAVLYPNRITTSLDKRNVDIQTLQYTDFLSVFTSLKGVKHAEILLWWLILDRCMLRQTVHTNTHTHQIFVSVFRVCLCVFSALILWVYKSQTDVFSTSLNEDEDSTKAWMWHEPVLILNGETDVTPLTCFVFLMLLTENQTVSESLPYESVLKVETIIYSFFFLFFFFFRFFAEVILLLI